MLLSPGDRDPGGRSVAILLGVAVALWLASGAVSTSWAQGAPVSFSAIGDIPYSDNLAIRFQDFVADHNAFSPAEFFVHVGDIQSQSDLCPESNYIRAADIMRELAVPAFIVPGDNEWNDCGDPDAAWALWTTHFTEFEQNFCGVPDVEAQAVRPENFAFVRDRVLFIGLNIVGGRVHDPVEWALRMQQNADWVEQQLAQTAGQVRAAVVFGQAERDGSRDAFFDRFDIAAAGFARPILYLHGDGHNWIYDAVWGVPNLSRIQIEQGDPPLEVTVTLDPQSPFVFSRDPWPAGTPILNRRPCVDAGPDQVVALGQAAQLQGFVTDDGDPTPFVALEWSQVSGPGQMQAVISDAGSEATTVSFPEAGTYVLRLLADDGELAASDDVEIFVDAGQPYLSISDATVVEGDTGTTMASFAIDLLSASGAPVSVAYTTLDDTAIGGSDYQASSGSVDFSGTTVSRTIDVPVIGDVNLEEFETFLLVLHDASGAVIADATAAGRILDDDIPRAPVVSSFLPARGPPGTLVAVTGELQDAQAVSVGGAPALFTMTSDTTLELIVPPDARSGPISVSNVTGTGYSPAAFGVEVPLSVAVIGEGSVDIDPPGLMQIDGATVSLTPLPAPGWEFLVWGGATEGSETPAVIEMDGHTHVTALFVEQGSVVRIPWSASVASGNDDAEENLDSGSVDLTSGDLELGFDVDRAYAVGLRFPGVGIPQGTPILSASVQFTVDEVSSGPSALTLWGEAADDAAPFSSTQGDVTGRPLTAASVGWNPPAWSSKQDAGAAQRTPDLAALIQEIVDRPGWASGNALVLTLVGSGTRTAESQDGNPGAAPRLDVLAVIDVAPPETPANLHAPSRMETSIALAWDASTDNLGVSGYRLYAASGSIDLVGTSYVASGLEPDTEYAFQVSAFDAAGNESPKSPPLVVRTLALDTEPPSTPANLRSPARTATTIELAWDASTDDRGVVGYRVHAASGVVELAATTWTATGLAPGTEYAYQVTAFDAAGNESLPSPLLRVRTLALDTEPPSTPANLYSPLQTTTRIDLVWDAATDDVGVSGYRLYRASGAIDLAGTTWTETGLVPGREYGFQIAALDAAGNESAPSPVLRVRTDRPPTTPANLRSPARTETGIELAWDAASDDRGVVAYRLYTPSGAIEIAGTTWTESGLTPDTEYAFQVSALDTGGNESPKSPPLVVRTLALDTEPPSIPANLRSPARTETSIELAWDASTDDRGVVGYRVHAASGVVELAATTWTATGLAPGTEYAYQVTAFDAAGNESLPSPLLRVRTLALDTEPPSTPANLYSPLQTTTQIELVWDPATDDVGVIGYRLYRASGAIDLAGTAWTETGLVPGREYGFQIAALDAAGNESAPSPVLRVRTDRPPTTPANLRSPARTETSIELAWDAASDDRGVVAYRLYAPSGAIDLAGTTWTASGLAPDTEYLFQVSALDTGGNESPKSPPLVVRTLALDTEPPSTPANLRSPARTATTIELAWDASTDDRGVVGYRVHASSGVVELAATTWTATGLAPDTEYAFQVTAFDAAGNESLPSPALVVRTVRPDEAPTTPGNLRSPTQTETSIDLAWDASTDDFGVTGYRVYGPSGVVELAATTWTATGLAPDTEYAFQVSALDTAGNESARTPPLVVRTVALDTEPPSTPANLRSPVQTETSIELAWDAASDDRGVVGYRVYGPSGAVDLLLTTWTATGLEPLTSYDFQVSALDAAGNESARSPVLSVSTLGKVPRASSVRIASGDDDAEENAATGAVKLNSADLELTLDGSVTQIVGLRFPGVAIPQGATIVSASVQFTADEVRTGPIALTLHGEAADHSAPFDGSDFGVSGRPPTTASVAWSPPDWTTVGAAGEAERTPDLSALVQEIVDRPGWASGNALVLVVSGTGHRTAESFEGLPGGAALLEIVHLGDPDTQAPTTPQNLRSPAQTLTSIDLAWDASTDDFGVTGYRVYGPSGVVDLPGTAWTATGLAPDTEYAFQVSALDEAGHESAASPVLVVRTVAPDREPPSTPQNLRSPVQTASRIELAWDAATDNIGVTGYRVYGPSGAVDVPGTSYTESGLELLTAYDFQVSALDAEGNESAPSPTLAVSTTDTEILLLPVPSGDDDAEENAATGAVKLNSADLELTLDGSVTQVVGLRFPGVAIPQGATIVSASVQFTADEVRTGPIALTLHGVAADHSAPFDGSDFGVSGRPPTTASVAWSPPDWTTVGAAGEAERTPDLSALVQEIVDRPGWASGNALVLVVSGTGHRTAESFEGAPAAAAVLRVEHRIEAPGPP